MKKREKTSQLDFGETDSEEELEETAKKARKHKEVS